MTHILKRTLITALLITGLCTTASANIVIDLNPAEGDQGVRDAQVKPGDVKEIELIAQQGAMDIEGFEVALKFDPNNFAFKGFQPGGLMTGAIALPPQKSANGVKISVGFLGRKSPGDAGSLGKIQIEVTKTFSGTAKISLFEGSFGAKGQTKQFPLSSEITLSTGASKGTAQPQQQPATQPGMNNQQPGTNNQQPGQQQGFQPPGQQQPGQPSPAAMRQMFNRWMQSPNRADMNKDGRVNAEDFKIWFDQRNNQQRQRGQNNQPGQGNQSGGGFQNQPPQGQGYHGGPRGQGGMGGPQGGPMGGPQGQGGMGGPQGGPMGGNMGPQGGQMGGPGEHSPNPEEAISKLPKALQGTFTETWKFSERAHMEAELKSQEKILKTLMETAKYVATASDAEKKQIAQVLMFFHMDSGEKGGPGGPMGQPQMPANANINDLIKKMTQDVTQDMAEIKKMLSTM